MRRLDPIKHDEKRREILEAAGRCFQRKGFKGSSISEICAEAEISPGHLYHYFDGKEAIIVAMAQSHLDALAERFQKVLARGDPIVDALVAEMNWLTLGDSVTKATLLFELLAESTRSEAIAKIFIRTVGVCARWWRRCCSRLRLAGRSTRRLIQKPPPQFSSA